MSKPSAILVIRLSSLGDCLLLGPVFRGLKKRFPNHRIIWITKPAYLEIWNRSSFVDEAISWEANADTLAESLQTNYSVEYTLDLQASPRSRRFAKLFAASHRSEAKPPRTKRFLQIHFRGDWLIDEPLVPLRYLQAANSWGVIDDGDGLLLPIDSTEVQSLRNELGTGDWVGLAPGAKHETKRWPAEYFIALAKILAEHGKQVLWIVGPEEKDWQSLLAKNFSGEKSKPLSTTPEYGIRKLIAAVSLCKAVVTNDSAVMHIAAGTDRPGIALFGPTIRQFGFAPFRSKMQVVELPLDCRPCSAHGSNECPLGHHNCMRDISVEDVWNQLKQVL